VPRDAGNVIMLSTLSIIQIVQCTHLDTRKARTLSLEGSDFRGRPRISSLMDGDQRLPLSQTSTTFRDLARHSWSITCLHVFQWTPQPCHWQYIYSTSGVGPANMITCGLDNMPPTPVEATPQASNVMASSFSRWSSLLWAVSSARSKSLLATTWIWAWAIPPISLGRWLAYPKMARRERSRLQWKATKLVTPRW